MSDLGEMMAYALGIQIAILVAVVAVVAGAIGFGIHWLVF